MKQRIITAIIAILVLICTLFFKAVLLRPAILILSYIGLWEFYNGFKDKAKALKVPAYVFTTINFIALFILEYAGKGVLDKLAIMMGVVTILLITLLSMLVFCYKKYNVLDVMVTFFGYVYVTGLFSYLYHIATYGDKFNGFVISKGTLFYLFILFAVSWGSDMGGYFTGLAFGKHKLCEKLSPKKTVEGAIGATLFSIIFGILIVLYYNHNVSVDVIGSLWNLDSALNILSVSLILGVLSIISQVGDFVASGIKRYVGIKDYSNIMPGHGGILDRFDSQIFTSPILFMIIYLFL